MGFQGPRKKCETDFTRSIFPRTSSYTTCTHSTSAIMKLYAHFLIRSVVQYNKKLLLGPRFYISPLANVPEASYVKTGEGGGRYSSYLLKVKIRAVLKRCKSTRYLFGVQYVSSVKPKKSTIRIAIHLIAQFFLFLVPV